MIGRQDVSIRVYIRSRFALHARVSANFTVYALLSTARLSHTWMVDWCVWIACFMCVDFMQTPRLNSATLAIHVGYSPWAQSPQFLCICYVNSKATLSYREWGKAIEGVLKLRPYLSPAYLSLDTQQPRRFPNFRVALQVLPSPSLLWAILHQTKDNPLLYPSSMRQDRLSDLFLSLSH